MPFSHARIGFRVRLLSCLLALLMTLQPCLCHLANAQEQASPEAAVGPAQIEPTYIAPGACAAAVLRPRQLLTSEFAKPLPVEVVTAFGLQQLGFDPVEVESVLITIGVPMGDTFDYAGQVTFTKDFDLSSVQARLPQHVEDSAGGKTYLKSPRPNQPSYYQPAPNVVIAASERAMERFLNDRGPKLKGQLGKWFSESASDDAAIAVDLVRLSALIQMGMGQLYEEVPQEYHQFLEVPSLLSRAEVRLSLSGGGPTELVAVANDEADADRIDELLDEALQLYDAQITAQTADLLASEDPVMQAMGRYQMRVAPDWAKQLRPNRDGLRFTLLSVPEEFGNAQTGSLVNVAIIGVLVGLLLPAVQAAREAARRNSAQNDIKNLLLGLYNYESANRRFPAHAVYDDAGKPLLSWRVQILPYLDDPGVYGEFRLDEPWDSEHNKQLISQMPEVFLDPSSKLAPSEGRTSYVGVLGPKAFFSGTAKGREIREMVDGLSNSVAIVQVSDDRAPIWTKPNDWQPDPKQPLKGLGGLHPKVFVAGFVDGHVESIPLDIDPGELAKYLSVDGLEEIRRP
ncbi:MAG: DUF1559 domain-containing protein [Planctomycetota bacterium]